MLYERAEGLQDFQESCVELEKQSSLKRNDAVVQTVVEDPVEDDRIPVEARMIPALCGPSEIEKMKHELTHITFQPWCVRLPGLKDVPVSDGLKVLSMYVKSFGYDTSTVVETKGATDIFAVMREG